jgi:hypothetical protein
MGVTKGKNPLDRNLPAVWRTSKVVAEDEFSDWKKWMKSEQYWRPGPEGPFGS